MLIITISVIVGYSYFKLINNISEPNLEIPIIDDPPAIITPKLEDQSFAILLIGLDYRQETGSCNTDALIVSIINPSTNKISLLSIPRDSKVYLSDYGFVKINSVYAKGEHERIIQERSGQKSTINGSSLLMKTLSDFLEIPINYYVNVDFKGFETIIDQLGGLEIYVDRDMNYYSAADGTNINLKEGLQILDGDKSLDYARFRKSSDGNDSNDFERNQRQQELIKNFVDEITSIKGASKMISILDITGEHVKVNMTHEELTSLFWKYKGIDSNDIESIIMESYWESPYVIIEQDELKRIKLELKNAFQSET